MLVALMLIVCTVVLIVHWPALSAQAYCFDDERYLNENPLVQNPGWASAAQFMGEIFRPSTVGGYSHPLTMISLMLDYAMGGRPEDLRQFHRTSLALHVMSTALVMLLLYLLFGHPWAVALVGLLFGLHPLTVEPIAWLSQRKTPLASCLALWSLVFYVLYAKGGRRLPYALSLIAYAASLLSKPSGMPLPFLMLLLDYWPIGRLNRRSVLQKVPFFVVCACSVVITLTSQARTMGVELPAATIPTRTPAAMCYKFMFYLGKIVWPVNLSSYYSPPEPLSLSAPVVLAAVVGTGLLWALVLASWWKGRAILVGAMFFSVALLPMMGLVGFSWTFAFDNYLYLPAVGLLLPLTWLACRLWGRGGPSWRGVTRGRILVSFGVILALLEARSTRSYWPCWQNTERFIRHMLVLSPNTAALHNILGGLLLKQGRVDEGARHLAESLRLNPSSAETHQNIAAALAVQGNIRQAIEHYHEALRLQPGSPRAHYNLGNALFRQGNLDEALKEFAEAVRIRPTFADAHVNLGTVLFKQGQVDQAIEHYAAAVRLVPASAFARKNLAAALASQGKIDQAIEQYLHLLRLTPGDADAYCKLGDLWAMQNKTDRAVEAYRGALRIDPGHPAARRRLETVKGAPDLP